MTTQDYRHYVTEITPMERQELIATMTPRMVDQYIPHTPHITQQLFLLLNNEEALFGGAAGGGKLILVDAKVLTPWGWKRNGDLKDGDMIVNPRDGGMARITKAWPEQTVESWIVTFDDGTSIECGEDHLWAVKRAGMRNKTHNRLRTNGHDDDWLGGYRVITTSMLRDQVDYWKRQKARGIRSNAPMIPVARATEFTITSRNAQTRWPLDPYLLGLLIGDGHCPSLTITTTDDEIANTLTEIVTELGGGVSYDGRYGYRITGKTGVRSALKQLGLEQCRSWEKFIPEQYLLSSLDTRIQLMRGLMDTDGYVDDRGHLSYTTVSKQLAYDVTTLARSLGAFVTMTTKTPSYTHKGKKKKGRLAYTVWIKPHDPEMFVFLDRKLNRVIKQQNQPVRRVVDVQQTGRMEKMRCITVDTVDGLYVTDDFIVTHNSDALLMAALQYAMCMDTELVTPNGWTTIRDVKVGDQIFDETGNPTTVVAKSPVYATGDRFKVIFDDDSELVVDGDHLWVAETFADRMSMGRNLDMPMRLVTTREMYRTQKTNHAKASNNWSVRLAQPLVMDKKELPIDPYLFGIWLGDGSKNDGTIASVDRDPETQQAFDDAGYVTHRATSASFYVSGLRTQLEALGVRNNKHVPMKYLRGDDEQRLALLQGLMDSDGTVDSRWGVPRFSNTNPYILDAVAELAHSFGWVTRRFVYEYKNSSGPASITSITFLADRPVFRLPRKFARQDLTRKRPTARGRSNRIVVRIIQLDEQVDVQCLTVDSPSHMFLAGRSMIPTHNCDVPGYSALLLRKTWPDLNEPGAIMDRARTWLQDTDAQPREGGRKWIFPSGARLSFGYIQHDKDKFKLQSAEYQFIGWDELTHWQETTYTYLFSRLRRPKVLCETCNTGITKRAGTWVHANIESTCEMLFPNRQALAQYKPADDGMSIFDIPLRMRAASNPGGVGHQWVRERFIDPKTRRGHALFIPSRLKDNPSLDQDSYVKNLEHLSPVDRERLLHGDWDVQNEGRVFHREWFNVVQEAPLTNVKWCRYWDMAATQDGGDYTVGCRLGLTKEGRWVVSDIIRGQWSPQAIEKIVAQTAATDGISVPIRIEQEGGSSGKHIIDHYHRNVLVGYNFAGARPTGDKVVRANPVASAAEAGNVDIVVGRWNAEFLDELSLFPMGAHDDIVDALSGAFNHLAFARRARLLA